MESPSQQCDSTLCRAVRAADPYTVKKLLRSKNCLDCDVPGFLSPLWEAVISGNLEILWMLVDAGFDVNEQHPYREDTFTPLKELAYHKNSVELARLLVKHGADVNPGGEESPLYLAFQNGNFKLAELLLEKGALIEQPEVLLSLAVSSSDNAKDLVMLLRKYMDLNVVDANGNNALHWLCESSQERCLEVGEALLISGVTLDHPGYQSLTPLIQAVWTNKPLLVLLFLRRGANIHQTTNRGQTALHFACVYHRVDLIHTLLDHGADVNALDNTGATPFSLMRHEILPAVEAMTEHLAKLNFNNVPVRQENMAMIKKHPSLYKYYRDCLSKFTETKRIKFFLYFTFFLILLFFFVLFGCLILDITFGMDQVIADISVQFFAAVNTVKKVFGARDEDVV